MNKRFALFVVLLVFPMILAACGGKDLSPEDAEKGISAAFSGNTSEAEKYLCKEEMDELEGENALPEGMTVDPSCSKDGDKMKCSLAMSMTVEGQDPITQSVDVTFDIKDGKLCGGDLTGGAQ